MVADSAASTAKAPNARPHSQTSKTCGCTNDVHGRRLLKLQARLSVSRVKLKHQQMASSIVQTTHILCRT